MKASARVWTALLSLAAAGVLWYCPLCVAGCGLFPDAVDVTYRVTMTMFINNLQSGWITRAAWPWILAVMTVAAAGCLLFGLLGLCRVVKVFAALGMGSCAFVVGAVWGSEGASAVFNRTIATVSYGLWLLFAVMLLIYVIARKERKRLKEAAALAKPASTAKPSSKPKPTTTPAATEIAFTAKPSKPRKSQPCAVCGGTIRGEDTCCPYCGSAR